MLGFGLVGVFLSCSSARVTEDIVRTVMYSTAIFLNLHRGDTGDLKVLVGVTVFFVVVILWVGHCGPPPVLLSF